ncbi:hypothetical protein DSM106972_093050 [Dulcicalothrix desertica PCC 7102]|uniref:Uncharacterized protein n=1 Tax=Dulcicalothrix desertica PCC 7102 TaxID=232991 RepID=A0A433ULE9_9CYAN|nr:hypothetical protein [Dulcicalothrix desertica]RUS94668.1 hypothetical protein DSM106972_093050 [Dulcicalothrix desertica PCC 7102]
MGGTNDGTISSGSRPERDNQQSGSILQQAWDSVERIRLNLAATVGAIDGLERSLREFEKRRWGNTNVEKTIDSIESNPRRETVVESGIDNCSNGGIEKGDFDNSSEQGVDRDKGGDLGCSTEPEAPDVENRTIDQPSNPEKQTNANANSHMAPVGKRGFDLDL